MGNSTISMVKNRKVKEITRVLPPCIGIATAPINGHGFNSYVKLPEFYHTSGYQWLSRPSCKRCSWSLEFPFRSSRSWNSRLTSGSGISLIYGEWTYGKFKGISGEFQGIPMGKSGISWGIHWQRGDSGNFMGFFLQNLNENMESLNGDLTAQQNGCTWDHYGDLGLCTVAFFKDYPGLCLFFMHWVTIIKPFIFRRISINWKYTQHDPTMLCS